MTSHSQPLAAALTCTAFDSARRIASGSYLEVALALGDYARKHADVCVLAFDNASGKQIDFDLSGSNAEIVVRLAKRFPGVEAGTQRAPGRPKLGVTAREVTLLPRHWEWLAGQPGGASVTLRKLVDDARRAGPSATAHLRKLHERAYHFMSAIAGNFANFEEASRALFANNIAELKQLISGWPSDIQDHLVDLSCNDASLSQ
jgi:uncharacterized protein